LKIRILNCFEEAKKDHSYLEGINNKKEIKENYLNENKIDFCFKYKFDKEGKYTFKFIFKKPLININYIFYECNKLLSIDLSNFNTKNINDISWMFYNCSSLTSLNLSNFNTNNVKYMSYMFYKCSSLTSLNLSNFNTNNVNNMHGMFNNILMNCKIICNDEKIQF